MEETIAFIESRIQELENPNNATRSIALQNPRLTSAHGVGDAVLGHAPVDPNEPWFGPRHQAIKDQDPPAIVMEALMVNQQSAELRPLPALMISVYLWGICLSESQSYAEYEQVYLTRAVDQASQPLSLDTPGSVLHKIQVEVLLAYYFFSRGRVAEGRYHSSVAVGLVIGSQLHKVGGAGQSQGICGTIWKATTDPIEQGERINAVWAVVTLNNLWTSVLGAPSDLPHSSPDFQIDTPWPFDAYDPQFLSIRSEATVQAFLSNPEVASVSKNTLIAKAGILLERAAYLEQQWRPDAPPNELANLRANMQALDDVIQRFIVSSLPMPDTVPDGPEVTLARTLALVACIKINSIPNATDGISRAKEFHAAQAVSETINRSSIRDLDFVNPIFGHLWSIAGVTIIREIQALRAGKSSVVRGSSEAALKASVDRVAKVIKQFSGKSHWDGE
ncbi:hypothetical protein ONZ45_g8916 [Pleurotus djamor]|nr:hypothetical protein ONZ45_g8916 [Pleurotus djamor]